LFADAISTASFYTEDVGIDGHDDTKVVELEPLRDDYVKNYKADNVSLETHPIMRRFDDPECDPNLFTEMAKVASVSCLHQCMPGSCGGNKLTGEGCRFDFPKKLQKQTVPAVTQVNANKMETRIINRTCDRVPNLNRYFFCYLRSNHDCSTLMDSAHKLRYCTKYAAKEGKHTQLLDEVIEHLNKRSQDLLPQNMKQVLSHLLLAYCSHRAFISKNELAYKVMNLPNVSKSFANTDVVGFYKRDNLRVPYDDEFTIGLSDRTEYSAYAERCRQDTVLKGELITEDLSSMSFSEFVETVSRKCITTEKVDAKVIDEAKKRKFRTRDIHSGHWEFGRVKKRRQVRPSTVLYTEPAVDYEFVQQDKNTTQTTFSTWILTSVINCIVPTTS